MLLRSDTSVLGTDADLSQVRDPYHLSCLILIALQPMARMDCHARNDSRRSHLCCDRTDPDPNVEGIPLRPASFITSDIADVLQATVSEWRALAYYPDGNPRVCDACDWPHPSIL